MKCLGFISAGFLLAAPLAAQEPSMMDEFIDLPGIDSLAARLKLTDEQRTELAAMRDTFRTDTAKERQDFSAALDALRTGREEGVSSDSLAVLSTMAQSTGRALRVKVQDWTYRMKVKLTPDQQAEWNRWMDERRVLMREEVQERWRNQQPVGAER